MINLNLGRKNGPELNRREKNWIVVVFGILSIIFLVFIITGTVLLNRLKKEKKIVLPPVTTPETTQLKKKEIAEKVLALIDTQKSEKGVYYFGLNCPNRGEFDNCEGRTDNRVGIRVIWAKFKLLQKEPSSLLAESIKRDLDTYTNKEIVWTIQNDSLNCSLMKELWDSGLFNEEAKGKIDEICWGSGYYHPPDLLSKENPKNVGEVIGEIQDVDVEMARQKKFEFLDLLTDNDRASTREFGLYPAEFVARYQWKNDINQLKKARYYFNKAIQLYLEDQSSFYDQCMLGISAVELGNALPKEQYVDFAKTLVVEETLRTADFDKKVSCLMLTSKLFTATGEKQYKTLSEKILDELILSNLVFDEQKTKGAFGFSVQGGWLYPVDANSLLIGLLLQ